MITGSVESVLAMKDLDAKLAAAERENERLREGIVWLECDIRTADIANAIGDHERWESHAAALLSPPTTQGEEVRDG